MSENTKREYIICSCENIEHQMVFTYFEEEGHNEVFCQIHLSPLPFWYRLCHAVKYIFGYRSRLGDFEEFILRKEDASKLQTVINHLNK